MKDISLRKQLEAYVKKKYTVESEQLPFNHEDYAILRHQDSGKWFAVFIVKSRASNWDWTGRVMLKL